MAGETSKSNPSLLIIGVVTFIVAAFFIGNVVAYTYAKQMYPSKPKKALGKKQMKRNALKKGVQSS
eukprot:CAMPEP_0181369820 /NCGR_PEP_ID=MMETSP1106-20121128/13026_1 /TAXON_ID=81844 /ORGANISM="Mantoniella antarctica, Strain SL-175" /LENGTH=65 /DNA_ID=CAMNT_0023486431 /DNA_START=208 /DNA_END=405 /DNA_ORIENTATION=-